MQDIFTKFKNSSAYLCRMVYIRAKKFRRKKDQTERTYFYLVEAKRTAGKPQQKVIRYLGTAETILKDYEEFDRLKSRRA